MLHGVAWCLFSTVVAIAYIIYNKAPETGEKSSSEEDDPDPLCKAQVLYQYPYSCALMLLLQSAINIFANQASFFWTDFISLFLFLSRKYGVKQASKYVPLFHIISWVCNYYHSSVVDDNFVGMAACFRYASIVIMFSNSVKCA